MLSLRLKNVMTAFILIIISLILVSDFFFHKGQSVAFDAPTHISNIAQIYGALADGEFPARWGDGFARYGMPIPIIAQQVTSYLGALFTFITHDVLISYYVVLWLGGLLSTVAFYVLLRRHVDSLPALTGAILFHFAPYRIMNVYIRGALPEFFSTLFILLIMIALQSILIDRKKHAFFLLIFAMVMLLLTHPFMMMVGMFVIVPYGLYLMHKTGHSFRLLIIPFLSAGAIAIGIAAYYLMPLFMEIKYFYYGLAVSHFVENHFLSIRQFFVEEWYYFYQGDIFPRAHLHTGGFVEGLTMLAGFGYAVFSFLKKKYTSRLLLSLLAIGVIIILLTQSFTRSLYVQTALGNIQHPWRMLSAYILIPPFILALVLHHLHKRKQHIIIPAIIVLVCVMRFPQLYGKNYTQYPQRSYFVTDYNLHGQVMNTVWMGNERDYPHQSVKYRVIEGRGVVKPVLLQNARREYEVDAKTQVRLVDYTFYYPGWKLYIDGVPTEIQFQDPAYRGVITYQVPEGKHTVRLTFEETRVRKLANSVTLISLGLYLTLWLVKDKSIVRTFLTV